MAAYFAELVDGESFDPRDGTCSLMDYGGDEWLRRKAALDATLRPLRAAVAQTHRRVADAARALHAARVRAGPACGGALLLVDLAGADYDGRAGQAAHKESIEINKSLLALKECLTVTSSA